MDGKKEIISALIAMLEEAFNCATRKSPNGTGHSILSFTNRRCTGCASLLSLYELKKIIMSLYTSNLCPDAIFNKLPPLQHKEYILFFHRTEKCMTKCAFPGIKVGSLMYVKDPPVKVFEWLKWLKWKKIIFQEITKFSALWWTVWVIDIFAAEILQKENISSF